MALHTLIDPLNPALATVWHFAQEEHPVHCKKTTTEYREALKFDVEGLCEDLKRSLTGHEGDLKGQTFYRTSMVVNGIQKVHNMQADSLLEDTKKLLKTMRKEKKAPRCLDDNIDYHAKSVPKDIELDFEQVDAARDVPAATLSAAQLLKVDWTTLDYETDFAWGPPRATRQNITLPDEDVPLSTAYLAELERLRAQEGTFEGPTLADWEETIWEDLPKPDEQSAEQSIPETLLDTAAAAPPPELIVPQIIEEEAVDVLPPIVEEPEATLQPQPPEEQPSQIELLPLEERQKKGRRQKKVKPVIDYITYLSNDTIRMQIQSHPDTLRQQNSYEDIVDVRIQKHLKVDILDLVPTHRRVMADILLKLFRPCETEAEFPDTDTSITDIARGTSHIEERDLSGVPSLLQDTSSLQRSRSAFLEVPSAQLDETALPPLESIEEHEIGAPPPPPPPSPLEGEVPSAAKEKEAQKPKKPKKAKEPGVAKTPSSRDADAGKQTTLEEFGFEARREETPSLDREESSELSEPHDQSPTELEMLMRGVLEHLATHPQVFFSDLLPEDATDVDASYLFEHLLHMHKDSKVMLSQEEAFGPIKITLDEAAEP